MTKQYVQDNDLQNAELEEQLLSSIFEHYVPIVYQGFNINFDVEPNYFIHDYQIEAAESLGYKISNFEMIVDKAGMSDHLHIWLHKIQNWE